MRDKESLKGAVIGCLAALVFSLGVWPVSANAPERPVNTPVSAASPQVRGVGSQSSRLAPFDRDYVLVVSAAAFTSDGFDVNSNFFPFGGGYLRGNANIYGCVQAPVYLPNGVEVKDLFASVYDNDLVRNVTITLRRVDNFTGSADVMASASTASAGPSTSIQVLNDTTIDHAFIRHPDYSYYLTTCLGSSDLRLYSVRINFNPEVFLPVVPRVFP